MYAIEFHAKIKNGLIEVPKEYRDQLGDDGGDEKVRVIVLADDLETVTYDAAGTDMIEKLLTNPLQVPDFNPLSRDDVHERS